MKTIIVLISLLFALPACAGDRTFNQWPMPIPQVDKPEYPYRILDCPPWCPDKPKKGYWEIKIIEFGKASDYLENNPQWEPFAVEPDCCFYLKRWVQ
ncbi:MAG: hypothetical protein HQK77_14195 [Desulfobacterales bacterium]|nr:hypothetical protein [Desulfobacterales bacterium]